MLKRITFYLLLLLFLPNLHAQSRKQKRINDHCQEGEEALRNFKAKKAIIHFEKALELNEEFPPAHRGLGIAYQVLGEPAKAAKCLERATEINPNFSRAIYYDIGLVYWRSGKYDEAIFFFELFQELQKVPIDDFGINGAEESGLEQSYLKHLDADLHACYFARDSVSFMDVESITNIGDSINTFGSEYFPFLTNQQDLLFYTSQPSPVRDEDLMVSTLLDSVWSEGKFIEGNFNSPRNEGMSTMTRDGVQLFFTACGRREVQGTCDIFLAKAKGDSIMSTTPLKGLSNTMNWESQASISCDGTQLFFASDRVGGYGGSDIWKSTLQNDGTWSEAINLGPSINTPNHEEAPFISIDGSMLFFSSTGHLGFGEQDVFASRLNEKGEWKRAVNLGAPINTAFREIGFFLSADGKDGYISSERPGGYGRMDIYKFKLSEVLSSTPITLVEGYVKDSLSGKPIATLLNINGRDNIRSDENGRFFLCLPAEETFSFSIEETNYKPYKKATQIPEWDNKKYFPQEVLLQPLNKEITRRPPPKTLLRNQIVYFDFDKKIITPTAQDSLNHYIANLRLHDYKKVYLTGYCDFKGSDEYNKTLSEQRASAVAKYLEQNGIEIEDIRLEGRGEVNDGKERWLNRRVEVVTKLN